MQPTSDVVEVLADGTRQKLSLRMRDLMKRISEVVEVPTKVQSAPNLNTLSTVQRRHQSLHARDLRSINKAPGLSVRRHVILCNFDELRVVILYDRMLCFGHCDELCCQLREIDEPAFELRALEAVLAVTTGKLARDAELLEPKCLKAMEGKLDHLERLRHLKNQVSYQETRARDTVDAIEATLDDDEDMYDETVETESGTAPLRMADIEHEDVEVLLENYLRHATATRTRTPSEHGDRRKPLLVETRHLAQPSHHCRYYLRLRLHGLRCGCFGRFLLRHEPRCSRS